METVIKSIYSKLLEFQGKVEAIKKDGQNTFFKKPNGKASTYATLPNILSEVKPLLNGLGLVLTQPIIGNEVYSVITDSESGQEVKSSMPLPNNLNAQQAGSAVTYFRRYTLSSLLSLEIDEDDDGNKASQKPEVKEVKKAEIKEKPYLNENSDAFTKAVDFLVKGGTIEEIEKKYNLSPTVKELLTTKAVA